MTAHDLVEVTDLGWQPTGWTTPPVYRVDGRCTCGQVTSAITPAGESRAREALAAMHAVHMDLGDLEDRVARLLSGQRLTEASELYLTDRAAHRFAALAVVEFTRPAGPPTRDGVLARRANRARALGLCGQRFSHLGVCDMPAGHEPISPGQWEHGETVGGPLGDLLDELHPGSE